MSLVLLEQYWNAVAQKPSWEEAEERAVDQAELNQGVICGRQSVGIIWAAKVTMVMYIWEGMW